MAEALVGFLLQNLNSVLSQETNLVLGVEDEVRSLQDELNLTYSYLKRLEGDRYQQDTIIVKEFVSQIRNLVLAAEDVIDTYVAKVVQQRGENILERVKFKFLQLVTRSKVAKDISVIRRRFKEIYENRGKFGIPTTQQLREQQMEGDFSRRIRRLLLIEETDVVGFERETKMIIERLTGGGYQRDVIPIVGMGGIGKTTLARKVFDDPIITDTFNFRSWVYVSQEYRARDLLLAIIKSAMVLTDEMKEMDEKELGLELCKFLRSTRYLIVLDDVWKTEFWEEVCHFFANNKHKSRIILTTRINEVALHVMPSDPPHNMKFLTSEESWKLLSKRVFRGEQCPQELEKIGEQIAGKCGATIGSCSTSRSSIKEREDDWVVVKSVNKEDSEIKSKQLVRLWLAEGFLQRRDNMVVEDVAEEYLDDLIDRNLIQVVKSRFDGGVKICRIHDLLRDLCITKAQQEKFLQVCGHKNFSASCDSRRLGIHSNTSKYLDCNPSASHLRTLLAFGLDEGKLSQNHWKSLYKRLILLRVLDLLGVVVDTIPNEIEKLICLRYLRLKSYTARTLPLSICNLWNLETLEVIAPCIDHLQINIWKMPQLRHLYFNGQIILREPHKRLTKSRDSGLKNLQSLSSLSPDSCTESVLSEMPNLIKLGLYGDLEKHKDIAFKNISRLSCLHNLKLIRDRRYEGMTSLPDWAEFPSKLTKLTLSDTKLSVDPMKNLGLLPNLQVLKMTNGAYIGSELNCTSDGFPHLHVLKLINLGITYWHISTGSMRSLRSVFINRCGNLSSLPSYLSHMSTLRELELWQPNVSMVKCTKEFEISKGKDQFKLHVYHS